MREDHEIHAPFLASLVVSKIRDGLPAPGFFLFARSLGRFEGSDSGPEAHTYQARELARAWVYWGN